MKRGISVGKSSIRKLFAVIAIICLLCSQPLFTQAAVTTDTTINNTQGDYYQNVTDFIKEFYNGDVSETKLLQGALKGMFATLDPYTTFFTPEEASQFYGILGDNFVGIGVVLDKKDDYVIITKAFPGSPAERAGLCPGDKIASVDGRSIIGVTTEEAASRIKGAAGTSVKIGIIKAGNSSITEVVLFREMITMNPVSYEVRNGIGYIKLESFSVNSAECVKQALDEMDKENITKIVLDLRDNGGGYVDQAVNIAGNFVPKGLITKLNFKSSLIQDQEFYSLLDKTKYKLAILVNGHSASASEILSAAVQDTNAGTLVGTKTFGKAKVQNLIRLLTPEATKKYQDMLGIKTIIPEVLTAYGITPTADEILGTVKITTGLYTTPKGRMIDLQGLTPDVTVPDPVPINGVDVNSIQKLRKVSKPDLGDNSVDVYNAEKILKLLGYDVDTPDSKLNDKTFVAIQKFQSDNNIHSYGILDYSTQQLLNDKLNRLYTEVDAQYSKAVDVLNKD